MLKTNRVKKKHESKEYSRGKIERIRNKNIDTQEKRAKITESKYLLRREN